MQEEQVPPGAQLFESLRAVGYELQTALADIIDNSVAAKASHVDVLFIPEDKIPIVAILDNGTGMSPDEARIAMQLAGTNALDKREESDLGRFGLGLKTASLSQCRKLTLVTKSSGIVTGLCWDLDHIAKSNSWSLLVLDPDEIDALQFVTELKALEHGTLVIWESLDRLLPEGAENDFHANELMERSKEHISLVFHRYLNHGGAFRDVSISVNRIPIQGADPFLENSKRVLTSPKETFDIAGSPVEVVAYTLPFINSMTPAEKRQALRPGGLRDSQGFYIYRQGRLVSWGTWFRLMPKNDLGKLARVRVDIPNSLDHLWSLDIKKSRAVPPIALRERLRKLAATMAGPSERVIRYRGRKISEEDNGTRPWALFADREVFRYEINREHPALEDFSQKIDQELLPEFNSMLKLIENTIPVQDIFVRMADDLTPVQVDDSEILWKETLIALWLSSSEDSLDVFLDRMLACEPFTELRPIRSSIYDSLSQVRN